MRGRILRNAAAVAQAIIERFANTEAVAFVVSGERWPDGGLRPAVEDLWGAGAVIAHLSDHGWSSSPKTDAARAAYNGSAEPEREALLGCTSRRELVQQGYGSDLTIAAEIYTSVLVPVLKDSRFTETRASSEARKRNGGFWGWSQHDVSVSLFGWSVRVVVGGVALFVAAALGTGGSRGVPAAGSVGLLPAGRGAEGHAPARAG